MSIGGSHIRVWFFVFSFDTLEYHAWIIQYESYSNLWPPIQLISNRSLAIRRYPSPSKNHSRWAFLLNWGSIRTVPALLVLAMKNCVTKSAISHSLLGIRKLVKEFWVGLNSGHWIPRLIIRYFNLFSTLPTVTETILMTVYFEKIFLAKFLACMVLFIGFNTSDISNTTIQS